MANLWGLSVKHECNDIWRAGRFGFSSFNVPTSFKRCENRQKKQLSSEGRGEAEF